MIDALIAGRLHAKPVQRTGRESGRTFTTAKLVATVGDGESQFINIIAFSTEIQATLLALDAGDAVAVAGPMTAKAYMHNNEPRPSLDLVAQRVLSPYQLKHKRREVAAEGQQA